MPGGGGAVRSARRQGAAGPMLPIHRFFRPLEPDPVNSKPVPADTVQSPLQEPRLPPGQARRDEWPVLHYGSVPHVDLASWDFRVHGLVKSPRRWTYEEFLALPQVQMRSDIHCVTRWSRYDNLWQGVSFKEVMRHVEA